MTPGRPGDGRGEDSGQGEGGPTGDVVGLVDAANPAATRIATGQRLEVEPGLGTGMTDGLESTAAFRARDGREPTIPDGENGSKLWIGRVDHREVLERRSEVGWCRGRPVGESGAPKGFRADGQRRLEVCRRSAANGDRPGCDPVAVVVVG